MGTDSPRLPPAPTWISDPASAAGSDSTPPVGDSAAASGIAAKVTRDVDLASHSSVLIYDNFVSKQYIKDNFQGLGDPPNPPTIDANVEIIDWPQYGLSAARCWAITTNQRVVAWHKWAEPRRPGKAWTRDYGDGHEHLFIRYLICLGEDLEQGFVEQGAKMPGGAGTYDWSTSGAVTLPAPSPYGTFEMRMWHGKPTGGRVQLGCYAYLVQNPDNLDGTAGRDASIGRFSGSGNPEFGKFLSDAYLYLGRIHCVEQEIRLNTVKDRAFRLPPPYGNLAQDQAAIDATIDNANPDGVLRFWIDGALVYEQTRLKIRGEDRVRIQDIPFFNYYHGGLGFPLAPFHVDFGALCVATEYIGPPLMRAVAAAATPATRQSLSSLAAAMQPGTWAELIAEDIDAVIGVGAGGTAVAIPYANSVPWCPIRKRIVFVGCDHGDVPARHIEYDDATNRWLLIERGLGSHNYQHVAVDPFSSDIYQRFAGDLYRYTGQTWAPVASIPFNISQVASVALTWWSGAYPNAGGHGVLTVYNGNTATLSAFDPASGSWLADLTDVLPGQLGQYHVVSAYSARHNCLVYGGGNTSQGVNSVDRQIWRLNADLSKTRMPDAPHSVGIYHGMNLVSDSASGNILVFGFGEAWELDPSGAGTWTRMTGARTPPEGLLSPNAAPACVISCDVSTYGVVVYVDALRTRKPRCRMWVYRSQERAQAGRDGSVSMAS